MLPVSRESKLLQDRGWSRARLQRPQGVPPPLPFSRRLSPTSGEGIWSPAGRRVPGTSPFPFLPLSSRLCLQATKALVTREEPGRPGRASSSRLPGSPPPPPLAYESRASGRLQPCQSHPQPPSSRDWPGRPLSPRKRRTRDSPELCPTRQVGVPGRLFPPQYPQYEPAVTACKNKLSTFVTALRGNDFYPHVFAQGGSSPRSP